MRVLIMTAAMFLAASPVYSQPKPVSGVKIKASQKAAVTVTRGKKTVQVDLAEDIAGCAFIEDGDYKRGLEKRASAASPAVFELIDVTEKDDQTYLILFSKAFGNCNVNGRCGASSANSLIWVHLDSQFKFVEKSAVTVEACMDDIILVKPEWTTKREGDFMGKKVRFPFTGNMMTVIYEKSLYGEDQKFEYELFTLKYDRSNPGKGFEVTSAVSPDSILDTNP